MNTQTNKPLPPDTAAIWGAFLYEGLMMAEHKLGEEDTLINYWKSGYLELITEACNSLPLVWEQACQQKDFLNDHPGIFEYEVISELGVYMGGYLASHEGVLPPDDEVKAAITHLVLSFFSQAGFTRDLFKGDD